MKQKHRDKEDDQSNPKFNQSKFCSQSLPKLWFTRTKAAVPPPNVLSTLNRPKSFYRETWYQNRVLQLVDAYLIILSNLYSRLDDERKLAYCANIYDWSSSGVIPRQLLFHHHGRTNPCCLLRYNLLLLNDAIRSWRDCDNYKHQHANAGNDGYGGEI